MVQALPYGSFGEPQFGKATEKDESTWETLLHVDRWSLYPVGGDLGPVAGSGPGVTPTYDSGLEGWESSNEMAASAGRQGGHRRFTERVLAAESHSNGNRRGSLLRGRAILRSCIPSTAGAKGFSGVAPAW